MSLARLTIALRAAALGVVLVGSSCASTPPLPTAPARPYDDSVLTMLVRYTAKEACSCAFVMDRDDDYCRAWVKASPSLATPSFDRARRRTRATALGVFAADAQWVDNQVGCALVTP